jgi:hypothetical protein
VLVVRIFLGEDVRQQDPRHPGRHVGISDLMKRSTP